MAFHQYLISAAGFWSYTFVSHLPLTTVTLLNCLRSLQEVFPYLLFKMQHTCLARIQTIPVIPHLHWLSFVQLILIYCVLGHGISHIIYPIWSHGLTSPGRARISVCRGLNTNGDIQVFFVRAPTLWSSPLLEARLIHFNHTWMKENVIL